MEPDSRISDVIHTLADPVEYVRGIVGSFVEYQFDKATSIVRIGTSGRGIVPNYSIETPCEPDPNAHIKVWVSKRHVFNGRNHKEILDDSFAGESWSSRGMNFFEVQSVLGQLRENRKRN
jgi:hypothetical protein